MISLLNVIPTADGGANGGLGGRVVAGIASEDLFKAILRFQGQYFPTQQSGFVDPGGAVLTRMEQLAARPAAVPKAAGPWGEFKSGSVHRALYKAVVGDHSLDHTEVVEILRATLANGFVSTSELDDLQMVAEKSNTIADRPKAMLKLFVSQAREKITKDGPYKLASAMHVFASNMACDFLRRRGNGYWPHLDRDAVGVGLLLRLAKPSLLRQGNANLCGPAAFLFNLLSDQPGEYTRYAIDMYEKGAAKIQRFLIKPSGDLRSYDLPAGAVDAIDWLTMASLRNSEDWFIHFDSTDGTLSGATTQMEMAWWFNRAGYSDIREDANLLRHQRSTNNMDEASRLFSAGYRVCLLIDDLMLYSAQQTKSGSMVLKDRHWVVLRSKIDRSGGNVKMTIFTWGQGDYKVPQGAPLAVDQFLENYYGYVAAKP
ncbi:hypothetical protein QA640_18890 [Bradyrhizobium sp. CB82]|uniref:hypothetical protein n=1 Tax=Bradyrhizobium sp. CB82 TaxID=3039159 RepID=UPI0024B1AA11|nr:hypothetical protein [Bradyrhizobium sp. CB82]WFU44325.1 hypothetical protein QA640_18890 [Bradyrhizobium sp. CB82]